jgi:hypothetical protein
MLGAVQTGAEQIADWSQTGLGNSGATGDGNIIGTLAYCGGGTVAAI